MAGMYSILIAKTPISLLQIFQLAIDSVAIYALYGYVMRQRIRNLAIRILYLAVVLAFLVRAATVLYFVIPNLQPWLGSNEQYVSLMLVLSALVMLLVAYAICRHATISQRVPPLDSGENPIP
jgi:hypothetical protein